MALVLFRGSLRACQKLTRTLSLSLSHTHVHIQICQPSPLNETGAVLRFAERLSETDTLTHTHLPTHAHTHPPTHTYRDTTPVPPIALVLFGGSLSASQKLTSSRPGEALLSVDGWITGMSQSRERERVRE